MNAGGRVTPRDLASHSLGRAPGGGAAGSNGGSIWGVSEASSYCLPQQLHLAQPTIGAQGSSVSAPALGISWRGTAVDPASRFLWLWPQQSRVAGGLCLVPPSSSLCGRRGVRGRGGGSFGDGDISSRSRTALRGGSGRDPGQGLGEREPQHTGAFVELSRQEGKRPEEWWPRVEVRWGRRGVGGRGRAADQPGGQTLSSPSPRASWPCAPGPPTPPPRCCFHDLPHPWSTLMFTHFPRASGESMGHVGESPQGQRA